MTQTGAESQMLSLRMAEDRWRTVGTAYSAGLAFVILMLFAWLNFSLGDVEAGWISVAGLPFAAATVAGCLQKPHMPAWAPYPLILFLTVAMFVMLHVMNVVEGGALMWFCGAPIWLIFALRARAGLAFAVLTFVMMVSAFFVTDHILTGPYMLRLCCVYLFITLFTYVYERNRERVTAEIIEAQAKIEALEGLLSICGWCHRKMRDSDGDWVSTEQFFQDRVDVRFSHSMCPDCASETMAEHIKQRA